MAAASRSPSSSSHPPTSASAPSSSRSSPSPRLRRLDSLASLTPLRPPSAALPLPLPPPAASPSSSAAPTPHAPSHPAAAGRRSSQPYTTGLLGLDLSPGSFSAARSASSLADLAQHPQYRPTADAGKALEDQRTRRARSHSSSLTPVHSFSYTPSAPSSPEQPHPLSARLHASCSASSLTSALQLQHHHQHHQHHQHAASASATTTPASSPPAQTWVPPPLRPSASSSPLGQAQHLQQQSANTSPPSHYAFGFTPTVPHAPNQVRPLKPRSRNNSSASLSSQGRRSTTSRGTTPPSSASLLPSSSSPPAFFSASFAGTPTGSFTALSPLALLHQPLLPSPRLQPLVQAQALPSHPHPHHQQYALQQQQQQQQQQPTYASPVARTNSLPSIYSHPAYAFSPVSNPFPLHGAHAQTLPHMDAASAAAFAAAAAAASAQHLQPDPLGLHDDQDIPDEAPPSYAPPLPSSTSHPSLGVLHPFYSQPEHAHGRDHEQHDLHAHAHARHSSEGRHGAYALGGTLSSSSSISIPRPQALHRARSFDVYSDASETEGERGALRFSTAAAGSRRRSRLDGVVLSGGGGRARSGGGGGLSSNGSSVDPSGGNGHSALGLVGLGRQGADGLGRGDSGLRARRPVLDTAESGLDINVLSTDGEEPLPTSLLRPPPRPPSRLFQLLESLPLIMLLRLLSVVPASIGTVYLLGRALGTVGAEGGADGGREDGSRAECVLAIFWTVLTGMQCFLLTSGLTRRWLAYYSLPSTLLRLLSLQTICWPMTSLTLKCVGPSRPLIGWVVIGTTTSVSNTVRIWVTSNIATYARAAGGGGGAAGGARGHRGTLREALSVANEDIRYASRSLLSIVIGGSGEAADEWDGTAGAAASATGGGGTAGRQGKTLTKGVVRTKRRMDWRSVIRQVVWPCLFGYWLTGWFLLLERDAYRRQDGRAAALGC